MPTPLKKFLRLLDPTERRRGLLVAALIGIMALFEMVGVASVVPFLQVVGNPESIDTNRYLALGYRLSGVESRAGFLAVLAGGSFLVILLSASLRTVTLYVVHRYVNGRRHSLAVRLLRTNLWQPYESFLGRHSSKVAKTILSEVDTLIHSFLRPAMDLLAHGAIALMLIMLLVLINPAVALAAAGVVGTCYGTVFLLVRRKLHRLGEERFQANEDRYRITSDAIADIKLVKLMGHEDLYSRRFSEPSAVIARNAATATTLAQVPKYLVETLAIGGILLIIVFFLSYPAGDGLQNVGTLLPVLGLYAFAGYRMLPSAQMIFASLSSMRLGIKTLDSLGADLDDLPEHADQENREALPLKERLQLDCVTYRYPDASTPTLCGTSLEIQAGSTVAVSGETGAGKTTLIDIIVGLLPPGRGVVRVDGTAIAAHNIRAWQRAIAYVPQEIVLLDASVRENIALGVSPDQIDDTQVERVARVAAIHRFITRKLENGYYTSIGERGIRLSGGQRQRIGIARALYHNPSLLILDEATNALDETTERQVLENLLAAKESMTLILVSHRKTTSALADTAIEVYPDGRVKMTRNATAGLVEE